MTFEQVNIWKQVKLTHNTFWITEYIYANIIHHDLYLSHFGAAYYVHDNKTDIFIHDVKIRQAYPYKPNVCSQHGVFELSRLTPMCKSTLNTCPLISFLAMHFFKAKSVVYMASFE